MYNFYLDRILLPVSPGNLEIKVNNQNRTMNLIDTGEINLIRKQGLTDVRFTCLIPQSRYPFAVYIQEFQPALFFINGFEALKNRDTPFQFIVAREDGGGRVLHNTNTTVTLEYNVLNENWARSLYDLEVEIRLKEYRHYASKAVQVRMPANRPPNISTQNNRPPQNPPRTRTHTVVRGDSLWAIARRFLGNGQRWREIYNLNPFIAQRNIGTGLASYTIYPRQVLRIPN